MSGRGKRRRLTRELWTAAVLATVGSLIGVTVHTCHPRRLPWNASWADLTANVARSKGIRRMELHEAREAVIRQTHVILDARSWPEYREAHIPGALSLPPSAMDARFRPIQFLLTSEQPILVYGAEPGDDAGVQLGVFLLDQGYSHVWILTEGWHGWKAKGLPFEHGPGVM